VAGRYKYAKKLGVYNRLVGMILAEDLVGANKKVRIKKNTLMTKELVDQLRAENFFEKGAHEVTLPIFARLDPHDKVNIVHVYNNEKKESCPRSSAPI
jgi:DNA-directed RNA polymerase subunit beta